MIYKATSMSTTPIRSKVDRNLLFLSREGRRSNFEFSTFTEHDKLTSTLYYVRLSHTGTVLK